MSKHSRESTTEGTQEPVPAAPVAAKAASGAPPSVDSPLFVVAPLRSWIALSGLGVFLIAAIVWLFVGGVVEVVQGEGLLVGRSQLYGVTLAGSGRVTEFKVALGDEVAKGQLLAVLDPTELDAQIEGMQKVLDRQVADDLSLTKIASAQRETSRGGVAATQIQNQESIRLNHALFDQFEAQLAKQQELLERGLVTLSTVLSTQDTLANITNSILSAESALAASNVTLADTESDFFGGVASRAESIASTRSDLANLEAQRRQELQVFSPAEGKIVSLDLEEGRFSSAGTQLLRIEVGAEKSQLSCFAYVPTTMGKRIVVGQECQLEPSVTFYNQYGYLLGTVKSVSKYAATEAQLDERFGESTWVSSLIQSIPSGLLVEIELTEDSSTSTGYKWTSAKGYPFLLEPGTMVSVRVVYETLAPIDLLVPYLRDLALGRADVGSSSSANSN